MQTVGQIQLYADMRDAGPLLGKLNHLIRCDCTTRNRAKEEGIQAAMDDLETR